MITMALCLLIALVVFALYSPKIGDKLRAMLPSWFIKLLVAILKFIRGLFR